MSTAKTYLHPTLAVINALGKLLTLPPVSYLDEYGKLITAISPLSKPQITGLSEVIMAHVKSLAVPTELSKDKPTGSSKMDMELIYDFMKSITTIKNQTGIHSFSVSGDVIGITVPRKEYALLRSSCLDFIENQDSVLHLNDRTHRWVGGEFFYLKMQGYSLGVRAL